MKIAILFLLFAFSSSSFASKEWTWSGFEVIGQKTVSREMILKYIPLKVGTKFSNDTTNWKRWCTEIKKELDFIYTNCSAVKYIDFKAYLTINVVEKGEESRIEFRESPKDNIPLANEEILKEFNALQSRMWDLFSQGKHVYEDSSKGYLNYSDSIMANHVAKLIILVPSFRSNLINVLKNDKNTEKRGKAATLLNWALNVEKSIEEVHSQLDDPEYLVRNNISRFMLHYFPTVNNLKLRRKVISSLSVQLSRPSHADRNKAIYGLLEIAKSYKSDGPYIRDVALDEIRYLANYSILNNVKEPAIELLKLIQD